MDSLIYRYQTNRNRLTHVDDPGGVAGNHSFDVDDQDTNTYTYDASGNMIGDTASGITSIVWTPSNKIQSITKGSTSKLEYTYDAMGNRVVKRYYQPASTLKSTTWYARNAQGNILSVYERPHADSAIKQSEVHIYGSSRLGIEQRGITYGTSNYAWIGSEQHRNAGSKRYELTDHLGNVRVTISDLLIARPTGFGDTTQDAEVIDRRDYYPFGMEMPGRRWRATGEDAARFGFNGKENDNEVKGEGNQQDYGFRIYDPRIARFLSVDPLTSSFPWYSPYHFAGNTPIQAIDLEGTEIFFTQSGERIGKYGNSNEVRIVKSGNEETAKKAFMEYNSATSVDPKATNAYIENALTNNGSVRYLDYFHNVEDVTNGAKLEYYADHDNNCFKAAKAQLKNEGVTAGPPTSAIQVEVDNKQQQRLKQPDLVENPIGASIYIQTQLNEGNPIMVGLEVLNTSRLSLIRKDDPNHNVLTSHFVVVVSSHVDEKGRVEFGYMDNASRSTGVGSHNRLKLDGETGKMRDPNFSYGRQGSYNASEVRPNKKSKSPEAKPDPSKKKP